MNVVLLGGPGSGKGTLAKRFSNEYNFVILSPGELYRKEYEDKTDFGIEAHKYWGAGGLCPDEMTNSLVSSYVQSIFRGSNFIFDGYPRRVSQAKHLDSICVVDLVLCLMSDDDTIIQRLIRRASTDNRMDDTKSGIKERLKIYHQNNKPIEDYYKNTSSEVVAFDASGSIEQSYSLATLALNQFSFTLKDMK